MLTLRQIEVIRAIMVTGTVGGAARLLNVSSPGISRVMKHAESLLGLKLFSRRQGRYTPTPEAKDIFSQINNVFDRVEDLQYVITRLKRGAESELRIGSVPSISNVMVPRAIASVRRKFPNLSIDIDISRLKSSRPIRWRANSRISAPWSAARPPQWSPVGTRPGPLRRCGQYLMRPEAIRRSTRPRDARPCGQPGAKP